MHGIRNYGPHDEDEQVKEFRARLPHRKTIIGWKNSATVAIACIPLETIYVVMTKELEFVDLIYDMPRVIID